MSYVENALAISRSRTRTIQGRRGNQSDFVQALRVLGARFPAWHSRFDGQHQNREDLHGVFLSCSRETWDWVFGPPHNIVHHRVAFTRSPFQEWECRCADGSVLCLGHLFQEVDGVPWVVLARMYFFQSSSRFFPREFPMLTMPNPVMPNTVMPNPVDELTSADLDRVKSELLDRLRSAVPSQEHVLAHWEQLDEIAKAKLATQIDDLDFELLQADESRPPLHPQYEAALQPPPVITLEEQSSSHDAFLEGELCLTEGRVGVVLVAGGMGTRLGFEQPKGMFPIGPVSGNSLFQVLIERIVALGRRYGVRIPLYLMTSDVTHKATVRFLRENDAFGLNPDDLRVFCQGTLPAIDATTRKLLLASPGELATCPDGHGGFLDAARKSGCFEDMARRGIDVLFYGQMDNPLLLIADPELIGHHLLANADITTQVVRRASSTEKVGMFVSRGPKVWILEYSELPKEVATATDDDGEPLFWAGNTGAHLFRVPFLKRIAARPNALPAHPCRKQVDHIDSQGRIQQPLEPNAIKFEKFIFDLMHHTNRTALVECDREATFAPVKNPDSMATDTAATARAAMVKLHTGWLRQAGTEVAPGVDVEISPLFALNKSELGGKALAPSIGEPTFLT